ncbi:MAG TPA: methyltransferase domain-containing protein [Mycobacteriales bacterium]|nr:methyltransferase domain-containing protein [Mycobacteriales bacterium]
MKAVARAAIRFGLPLVLIAGIAVPELPLAARIGCACLLVALWLVVYVRYRQRGIRLTQIEWEQLRTATPVVFSRHYNECVPTVEEELDMWSDYHGHRHEMRYRLVGDAALERMPEQGVLLDIGCGSALIADRLRDWSAHYIGLDFGGHHIESAARRYQEYDGPLRTSFLRGDGEHLPLRDRSVDVIVFTEVIEHLLQPELAVWEIARVLKPGGALVMTTNNASEMPLRFPLFNPGAFLEKALGFAHDGLISHRPWVWPYPVSQEIVEDGTSAVFVPHTWHKQAETRRMFEAAGLTTVRASSFEFPPPQSKSARWLDRQGRRGRWFVDRLETVCTHTPLVNRLGCHLMMVATRTEGGLPEPPAGIWPGPFSKAP